jgi:hypothetical protein
VRRLVTLVRLHDMLGKATAVPVGIVIGVRIAVDQPVQLSLCSADGKSLGSLQHSQRTEGSECKTIRIACH